MTELLVEDERSTETGRLKRRREIRERIARRELTRRRAAELRDKVASIEAEAEAAADRHRAVVDPLRAELQKTEDAIIQAMARRQPTPDQLDARRLDLVGQIDRANEDLETEVDAIRRRIAAPAAEADRLEAEAATEDILENALVVDLANPRLKQAVFVAEQAVAWANARYKEASKKFDTFEYAARVSEAAGDDAEARIYRKRNADRWGGEMEAAGAALDAARDALAAATRRVFEE